MSHSFMIISSLLVGLFLLAWIFRFGTDSKMRVAGAVGVVLLFLVTALIGRSGVIADFTRFPPPFFFYMGGIVFCGLVVAFSPWGTSMALATPFRVLVGIQAFRFLPETLLALAWRDGLAPIQMTFHGRNADILTAGFSLILYYLWPKLKRPRIWTTLQTILGLATLLNILVIAILSAPLPIRVFMNDPANTFVGSFPYNWLPGIHVFTAWFIHLITIRKLLLEK